MNMQSLDLEFKINKNATGYVLIKCNSSKPIITIPSQYNGKPVISIGKKAFEGCCFLRTIFIPSTIAYIGDSAFFECSSLMCITIPNSVIYIEKYAFMGCKSLRQLTIGNSVKSIGELAFYGCNLLTNVKIPDSVLSIGVAAFKECYSLKSITIPFIGNKRREGFPAVSSPEILAIIGNEFEKIFNNDRLYTKPTGYWIPSSLKEVIITKAIIINDGAFNGCKSLEIIVIPNSVISIGKYAFLGCNSLKTVYFTGTEEQWNSITIELGNEYLTNAAIHYNYKG